MRPVLVLLNGIPASGKSTLALAWCALHAAELPLAIDIDVLRSMLGGWQASPITAGLAARALAVAAIEVHLAAGRDVIVPQWVGRRDLIDRLARVAEHADAAFVECALTVDPAVADRRFRARDAAASAIHGALTAPLDDLAVEFERFLAGRPDVVRLVEQDTDRVVELDRVVEAARVAVIPIPIPGSRSQGQNMNDGPRIRSPDE